MLCVLTWHGWRWGGLCAYLLWMELGWFSADLAWVEVGWSVYLSGMDGVGVVCVLTWHGLSWGGLCANLAWMELGWSVC